MHAIGLTEFGGPEVLRPVDVPAEPSTPDGVRIRVVAAAVNPTDTYLRAGARHPGRSAPPGVVVPGMDVAGVVTEVADPDSTDLRPGDPVMAIVVPDRAAHGGYREEVVLPARSVVRIPHGATAAEAATLPMNGLTARQALDLLNLKPGQTLGVTGAAGVLGGYLVQLATVDGLTVVADSSPEAEPLIRRLGADIIVERGEGFADRVRQHLPDGVDALVDAAQLGTAAHPAVRTGGGFATVNAGQSNADPRLTYLPVTVRTYATEHEKLDQLRLLAERGQLTPRVAEVLPAASAPDAHRRLTAGGTRGRLILRFN